jgi:Na+/proline symporter
VQRILTCRDLRAARKAMVFSGVVVIAQFALFLLWGLFIKALLNARHFASSDEIVPFFIVHHMPAGLRGLALAGIFAAAMSTLGSTINSLSSSTVFDILGLAGKNISEQRKVTISRWVSALWTCVIIAVSMAFKDTPGALVEIGLSIASITYGSMMGIFVMGRYFKGMRDSAALVGVFVSIAVMCVVALTSALFWLWYVAAGFFVALAAALLVNLRPRLS